MENNIILRIEGNSRVYTKKTPYYYIVLNVCLKFGKNLDTLSGLV